MILTKNYREIIIFRCNSVLLSSMLNASRVTKISRGNEINSCINPNLFAVNSNFVEFLKKKLRKIFNEYVMKIW